MTRVTSRMTRMKDGVLLIRSEVPRLFLVRCQNVILLIFMNTGTGTAAIAEEAIFTDINIFCYLNARSTAAKC
jgi:hypothetical protein